MVARLLGFSVVRGDMHCIQDTPPVGVPDSVTITCPYQVKVRALELPLFSCLQSRIHVDRQLSKFSNHAVTIFDIQIVIMGWTHRSISDLQV